MSIALPRHLGLLTNGAFSPFVDDAATVDTNTTVDVAALLGALGITAEVRGREHDVINEYDLDHTQEEIDEQTSKKT